MADGIHDLDATAPIGTDPLSVVDDDLRDIKEAIKGSFTHIGANSGVVNASAEELNYLSGVTSNIQAQLDAKQIDVWTFPDPDDVSGSTETWNLQTNTRIMPRFTAGGTIIKCVLPPIASATEGDAMQVRAAELDISPGVFFQLEAPGLEDFRLLAGDLWVTAEFANFAIPPWPHVLFIFSSSYNAWIVRPLNVDVAQFS